MMENYDYVRFLGQGSYGEVQLVKHVLEGKEVLTCPFIKYFSNIRVLNYGPYIKEIIALKV